VSTYIAVLIFLLQRVFPSIGRILQGRGYWEAAFVCAQVSL